MNLEKCLPDDDFPWTGKRKVSPAVRVKMRDMSDRCFSDTSLLGKSKQNYLQRMKENGVTPGNIYEVDEIEGFGDMADVHIKETDTGSGDWFMSSIFEDAD